MILDGSRGWYWKLNYLPELVKEHDAQVRFNIVERQIGDRFCASTMQVVDESMVIAYNIGDSDTLLGILFDESLKSKCIAAIDVKQAYGYFAPSGVIGLDITIVLVQGSDQHTNIDSNVLDCFSRVMEG